MKNGNKIPAWLPYLGVVLLFLAMAVFYFAPQMEGKELSMGDITHYEGMSHDIKQMQAEGEDPQWAGNAFGGMPAYMINIEYPSMIIKNVSTDMANALGRPTVLVFLALVSFWVMLLLWGVNPWVAIVPAIAYGFSTYSILIIGAGHITKMFAFAYAPLLVGGVVYVLRGGRLWLGGLLTALFAALQIAANHPQVTYYFLFVILAVWINYLVVAVKEQTLREFARRTAVLVAAAVLAVGANFSSLYYTAQHQSDTTRGGSELASENSGGGLAVEDITQWSYGRVESLNMFIPNLMGGSSLGGFEADGEVADALRPYYGRNAGEIATYLPGYWGDQPMTAGPTYLGAAAIFLAVLGIFLLKGREKWWLVGISLFALLLSWGSNMMWFTELASKVLPMYTKFRPVTTVLVIVQWAVPLLAALVLWRIWRAEYTRERLRKSLIWTTAITGGVALLFALLGDSLFSFTSASDAHIGLPEDVVYAMAQERASMLTGDAFRSLVFVVLTAVAVWFLYDRDNRRRRWVMVAALGVLITVDMVQVDRRYLSWDDFMEPTQTEILPTEANLAILQDREPGYRVANFAVQNPFAEAHTSYFHRSVGGYHAAKLSRYDDLIKHHLEVGHMGVYDMLNTKYFIVPDEQTGGVGVMLNEYANGPAWFVNDVVVASTPREEITLLGEVDTKITAVVEAKYVNRLEKIEDSTGEIALVEYRPNYLKYRYNSTTGGLCIFSEIYYDKGWTAYVDGVEADYMRADYVLRAMVLPEGEHTVEWRFRAPAFGLVEGVTLTFSLLILGGLVVCAVWPVVRRKCKTHK